MRKMKKITIMLMSVMLLIGMFGINTFAAETSGTGNPTIQSFELRKTIHIDKNVQTMPSFRFTYSMEQITSLDDMMGLLNSSAALDIREDLKEVIDLRVFIRTEEENRVSLGEVVATFDAETGFDRDDFQAVKNDSGAETNLYYYTESWPLLNSDGSVLKPDDFPEVGFYVYKVTENQTVLTSDATQKWNVRITPEDELICSKAEFIMIIPVGRNRETGNKEFVVRDSIILKTKNDDGTSADVKVTVPEFVNVYQRNDSDEFGLEILKQVQGNRSNINQYFDFTISIERNATEPLATQYYEYEIYNRVYEKDSDGKYTDKYEDVLVENSKDKVYFGTTSAKSFQLKHNQILKFSKFPVGTRYTLTEDTAGYLGSAAAYEGDRVHNVTETDSKEYNIGPYYAMEDVAKVEVTNKKEITPDTGVVTDNLSFVILSVVSVVGITGYTILKRRLRNY